MKKYRVEVVINVFEVEDGYEEVACTLSGGSQVLAKGKMLETLAYLVDAQVLAVEKLLERPEDF